ncbi:MAG: hypothetical protein CMF04_03915 [Hyphomonas sp.]|nr:hypothetical protein [Hyphomonas sp.]
MRVFSRCLTGIAACAFLALVACGQGDTPVSDEKPTSVVEAQEAAARAEALEAQKAAYEAALAEAKASRGSGEPALWTLRDEDTTLYIMGTVHLLRPDLKWRSDAIDTALEEADTVVFEADVTSQQAASEMMRFISSKGMFTDGRQLTSLLSEVEQAELQKALDHLGLPLGAVQPMKPWWAAVNLSVMQIQQEGFDPNSGVEKVIELEAVADGKSFAYLETIDEQLGRLAGMPEDEQVDFLIG